MHNQPPQSLSTDQSCYIIITNPYLLCCWVVVCLGYCKLYSYAVCLWYQSLSVRVKPSKVDYLRNLTIPKVDQFWGPKFQFSKYFISELRFCKLTTSMSLFSRVVKLWRCYYVNHKQLSLCIIMNTSSYGCSQCEWTKL